MNSLFDNDLNLELKKIKKQISDIQNLSQNKLCIYTCLIGDFDKFNDVKNTPTGFDSFLITDNKIIHDSISKTIIINSIYRSQRRTNRIFKILPHLFFSSYDTSVYFDCNLIYKVNPIKILNLLKPKYDFAIFNHAKRNCLFDEIDECIFWNKDSKAILNTQRINYNLVPKQNGLYLGSVLIRNHNKLKVFSEFWWLQYDKFSARDQISLAFTFFKIKINFDVLNISDFHLFFKKVDHIKKNVNESKLNFVQSLKFKILMFIVELKKKF